MNTAAPDPLKSFIDRACRGQPALKAPTTLIPRIVTELERRAALPWWRRSFNHWPAAMRVALVIACLGAAAIASSTVMPLGGAFRYLDGINGGLVILASVIRASAYPLLRDIPAPWVYGCLTGVGMLYVLLAGLGAAAYRSLYATRLANP